MRLIITNHMKTEGDSRKKHGVCQVRLKCTLGNGQGPTY
jgi:hypothetical protein